MISLYSGTPGSGKSLHCARTIINWSRLGYPVVGNFQVDLSKYKRADFTYCPNDKMTPDYLIKLSREKVGSKPKEGSILLVIDECQLLFNAREWQQSGRAQWLSFFTQHRKLGYDIILIAQFDRMVDRQIRSLIEHEYIHRKMSNFGWQGKIMSLVFGGNTFIAVKRWYPLHERLGSEIFHARKWMYSVYDTYAAFSAEGDAEPDAVPELPKEDQSDAAASAPETVKVVQGEVIQDKRRKLWQPREKPEKQKKHRRPRCIPGKYERPWMKPSKGSGGGKFLRPGGRDERGWTSRQRKLI